MSLESDVTKINVARQNEIVIAIGGHCCNQCRHCGLCTSNMPNFDENTVMDQLALAQMNQMKTIKLYTFGSWPQVPRESRLKIIQQLTEMPGSKKIVFECRPELVKWDWLEELNPLLERMTVEIGLGLDHIEDYLRNGIIGRNHTRSDYFAAVQRLYECGIKPLTYVAIGCPFLTEREAIESTVKTAQAAIAAGSAIISLEPLEIQPNTLQAYLADQGLWQPPWLWTIAKVMKRVWPGTQEKDIEVQLGALQVPIPTGSPSNRCEICADKFQKAFTAFTSGNIQPLLELDCSCRDNWREILDQRLVPQNKINNLITDFDKYRRSILARAKP